MENSFRLLVTAKAATMPLPPARSMIWFSSTIRKAEHRLLAAIGLPAFTILRTSSTRGRTGRKRKPSFSLMRNPKLMPQATMVASTLAQAAPPMPKSKTYRNT